MIDLTTGVFSCFGSHLSVFAMREGAENANRGKRVEKNTGRILHDAGLKPGFYFRNFIHRRDYETNLFAIRLPGYAERCPRYRCVPERLEILEAERFDICYAAPGTLLVRTGCALHIRCDCLSGETRAAGDAFSLYDGKNHYALAISCVSGRMTVDLGPRRVDIAVEAGSVVRVDEAYDPIAAPRPVPDFDDCVRARRAEYEAFLSRLPKALPGDEPLMALAAYGLWSAMASARGNYRRDCMLVSKNYMCGMWSWDHCFAAMAMAYVSPERAWDQLMCMFDDQREDGRIPDCIEAVKAEWGYVKPPIHGLTLDILERRMTITDAQRREAYDRLSRWALFWLDTRDPLGESLPRYLHGNDSGWDNNTVFDRPGPVQSAELPAYLAILCRKLAALAEACEPKAASLWRRRADRLQAAMLDQLVVDGLPIARLADTHERVSAYSPLPYMAITLGEALPADIRARMLEKLDDPNFLTPYGIASEALDSPEYQPDGYSRGSVWSYGQFLPVVGLLRMGERAAARRIMNSFLACCRKGGFSECFCATDGSGQRDRFLNWSVCVYVLFTDWLRRTADNKVFSKSP